MTKKSNDQENKQVPPTGESPTNKWKKFAQEQGHIETESELQQEQEQAAAVESDDAITDKVDALSDKQMRDRLIVLEKDMVQYQEQAFRAQAELENVRRRLERDVTNAHKFGAEKLVSELLPVIDSLVRALEGVSKNDPALQGMREGLELTLDMFHKALEKQGVESINPPVGTPFNPDEQEAMSMQKVPDAAPNSVLQVLQKGYKLNGRVVRAAMVMVAS